MSEQSRSAAAVWSDAEFAQAWLGADPQGPQDLLELPRHMAAQLVAEETPQPGLIVDVASGAGKFLSVLLDAFPDARGVWTDVSDTMLERARTDLARFGDRVDFTVGDMGALRAAGVPEQVDVLITSRASHHLAGEELRTSTGRPAACSPRAAGSSTSTTSAPRTKCGTSATARCERSSPHPVRPPRPTTTTTRYPAKLII